MNIKKRSRLTDTKHKLVVTSGEDGKRQSRGDGEGGANYWTTRKPAQRNNPKRTSSNLMYLILFIHTWWYGASRRISKQAGTVMSTRKQEHFEHLPHTDVLLRI